MVQGHRKLFWVGGGVEIEGRRLELSAAGERSKCRKKIIGEIFLSIEFLKRHLPLDFEED